MSGHTAGLRYWLLQRISAVYLAGFAVYLLLHFLCYPPADFQAWSNWITHPLVAVLFAGFVLALLVHGWIGVRDVVLDYIHHLGLRLTVLTLLACMLIGCGFWAARVLIVAGL